VWIELEGFEDFAFRWTGIEFADAAGHTFACQGDLKEPDEPEARHKQIMSKVRVVGIDETGLHGGHDYRTDVHDVDGKRLLFCTPGRADTTVQKFAAALSAHGGEPSAIAHACIHISAACLKGVGAYLLVQRPRQLRSVSQSRVCTQGHGRGAQRGVEGRVGTHQAASG